MDLSATIDSIADRIQKNGARYHRDSLENGKIADDGDARVGAPPIAHRLELSLVGMAVTRTDASIQALTDKRRASRE